MIKKCIKQCASRAGLLFCWLNQLFFVCLLVCFLTLSLPSPSGLPEIPTRSKNHCRIFRKSSYAWRSNSSFPGSPSSTRFSPPLLASFLQSGKWLKYFLCIKRMIAQMHKIIDQYLSCQPFLRFVKGSLRSTIRLLKFKWPVNENPVWISFSLLYSDSVVTFNKSLVS